MDGIAWDQLLTNVKETYKNCPRQSFKDKKMNKIKESLNQEFKSSSALTPILPRKAAQVSPDVDEYCNKAADCEFVLQKKKCMKKSTIDDNESVEQNESLLCINKSYTGSDGPAAAD